MERIVEQAFLYDFYGELLTEHQRKIYGDFILDNLSLGEIAENSGISRQGVHDLIRRCDKILETYEGKLHLLEKFLDTKQKISRIQQLVKEIINLNSDSSGIEDEEQQRRLQQVDKLVENLIEHL